MKKCKKLFTFICIALVAVMCLSACQTATPTLTPDNTAEATPTPTSTPTPTNTEEPTPPPTPTPTSSIRYESVGTSISSYESYFAATDEGGMITEAAKLIDGNKATDMTLTFDPAQGNVNPYIVFDVNEDGRKFAISGYRFVTGNGTAPKSWKVYGIINGGTDFVVIDTVTNGELSEESVVQSKMFYLDRPGIYSKLKIEFTHAEGANEAETYVLSEILAYADSSFYVAQNQRTRYQNVTVDNRDYNYAIVNNYIDLNNVVINDEKVDLDAANNLFDINIKSASQDFLALTKEDEDRAGETISIEIEFKAPTRIDAYRFYTMATSDGWLCPRTWTVYATTLDDYEIVIDATNDIVEGLGWAFMHVVNNPGIYKSLRFEITEYFKNNPADNPNNGKNIKFGSIFLFADKDPEETGLAKDYTILNPYVDLSGAGKIITENRHEYTNRDAGAVDLMLSSTTTWHGPWWQNDTEKYFPYRYTLYMVKPVTLTAYTFDMTRVNSNQPKSWKLYGAYSEFAESSEYELIHEVKDETWDENKIYTIDNPKEYTSYRLIIDESYGGTTNCTIGELYLLGAK